MPTAKAKKKPSPTRAKVVSSPGTLTKEELAAKFAEFPSLDVLDRRLSDPNDPGTLAIYLAGEQKPSCGDIGHAIRHKARAVRCSLCKLPFRVYYVRWANLGEEGRWTTLRQRGYQKVTKKLLTNADDIVGMDTKDAAAFVTRGDRGQEVLIYMPFPYWVEIRRERERLARKRSSPAALKQAVIEGAEREFGDEAAQVMHDDMTLEVKTVKTTLAEEARGAFAENP